MLVIIHPNHPQSSLSPSARQPILLSPAIPSPASTSPPPLQIANKQTTNALLVRSESTVAFFVHQLPWPGHFFGKMKGGFGHKQFR